MVSIESIKRENKRIADLEKEMQRQKASELKNNPDFFKKELEKEVKHNVLRIIANSYGVSALRSSFDVKSIESRAGYSDVIRSLFSSPTVLDVLNEEGTYDHHEFPIKEINTKEVFLLPLVFRRQQSISGLEVKVGVQDFYGMNLDEFPKDGDLRILSFVITGTCKDFDEIEDDLGLGSENSSTYFERICDAIYQYDQEGE